MTQAKPSPLADMMNALSSEEILELRQLLDRKLAAKPIVKDLALTPNEEADFELQKRLFELGILSEIKPPSRVTNDDEPFAPIVIIGEPLSETIIRERR